MSIVATNERSKLTFWRV